MKNASKYTPLMIAVVLLLFGGCAGKKKYQLNLLPAPDVYASGIVNPFTGHNPIENLPYRGVLYVTGRAPALEEDDARFYTAEPGRVVRLGWGRIEDGIGDITWEEARRISLMKERTQDYPLSVESIEEIGLFDRSYNPFMDPELVSEEPHAAAEEYAELINKKLATSKKKDIYIFVHGYNTNFEDPLLVASELWHYLGYDGVFIAYCWPATDSGTAYLGDMEKAKWSSRNLRLFLEYLSDETDAENIHIAGYSMGTRVTTWAIEDLALIHMGKSPEKIRKSVRVGHVVLMGSDLSPYSFGNFLKDGLLNVTQSYTIYTSEADIVLGASNWLFDRIRMGQITKNMEVQSQGKKFLEQNKKLRIIDVTDAKEASSGKGHQYFRNSPWVSSDLLMTFMYGLPPEKRGLIQQSGLSVWEFPTNYIERLRESLSTANPAFEAENKE